MKQPRVLFAPKVFGLSVFELVFPLALIASVAVALATPNQMLPQCLGGTPLSDEVWPLRDGRKVPTAGTLTVQAERPAQCFRVVDAAGVARAHACHPGTICTPTADPKLRVTAIHRFDGRDGYYANVGTRCDSACCDLRGFSFSPTGQRLDDGPRERVCTRANCNVSSWVVPVALLWALASLIRRALGTRTPSTLAGLIAGCAVPILLLWRFL